MAPISTSKEAGGEGGVAHKFFYPSTDADVGVVQYSSTAGASAALTKMVAAAAKKAIKARGAFTIAVTGGLYVRSHWFYFTGPHLTLGWLQAGS